MKPGETYVKTIAVTEDMLACNVVPGTPPLFGTPSLLTLIEAAGHEALASGMEPGQTSVGSTVNLTHSAPTPLGMRVRCEITLVRREGVMADFEAEVFDEGGSIATAKHSRAIVDRQRLVDKAIRRGMP